MITLTYGNAPKLPKPIEMRMARMLMIDAFLKQKGARIFRTLRTVSVSFEQEVAAEEFERLLKAGMRS